MDASPQPSPAELDQHRPALVGHCYRMLGSLVDADDAVQETMVRAFRGLSRFDGRASLKTWLTRIATNVCIDSLSARKRRRFLPFEEGTRGSVEDTLTSQAREHWLEPVPDALAVPSDVDPAEAMLLRESIRLAFVSALQRLPPKQRAALLLTNVLGFSAAEAAECLEVSVPALNSALQRARATLADQHVSSPTGAGVELDEDQARLLERFVDAFERYDTEALASMLRDDAIMSMPPFTLWLQGPEAIQAWLSGRGIGCKGSRLLPTRVCGVPGFAQYRPDPAGGHVPWALIHLETHGDRIQRMIYFLDTETLFPRFGLPDRL